jgi:hypothetical protein
MFWLRSWLVNFTLIETHLCNCAYSGWFETMDIATTGHLKQSPLLVVEALLLGSMHAQMPLINATRWRGIGLRKDTAGRGWQITWKAWRQNVYLTAFLIKGRWGVCSWCSMSVVPPFFREMLLLVFRSLLLFEVTRPTSTNWFQEAVYMVSRGHSISCSIHSPPYTEGWVSVPYL